ncbi:MAG: 2-succinyl-6-hydroxy-2,4-cyclohexadiene-1-carboxylate synthase [Cyanobacteria bacterium P01_A01_bin.37]
MSSVVAQTVQVGGYRFHVRRWQESTETCRGGVSEQVCLQKPVLWLHGFMGSGNDWDAVINQCSDLPHSLAPDLPGHGKTEVLGGDESYHMAPVAEGIIQLLDRWEIESCHLVGYSMGGRLALYLALQYPTRFCRVVIESASPGLKTTAERQSRREWDEAIAHDIESTDFRAFLNRWYQQPLFASLSQHPCFPDLLERRLQNSPDLLGRSLRYMGSGQQPSLWDALNENATPILLVVGEHDSKYRRIADEIGDRHQHCQCVVIPNCGHTVHLEQAKQFINHVQRFFDELPLEYLNTECGD